jgi:hypothetical protein
VRFVGPMAAMRSAVRLVTMGGRAHGAVARVAPVARACAFGRRSGLWQTGRSVSTSAKACDLSAVASAGGDAEIVPDFGYGEDVEMVVRK